MRLGEFGSRGLPVLRSGTVRIGFWLVAAIVAAAALWTPANAFAAGANPALVGLVSDPVSLSGVTSVAVPFTFLPTTYAYGTVYYRGTLSAVNMSNPAQPVLAGESASANSLVNATTVNIVGGYAYVVSKNRNRRREATATTTGPATA